MAQGMPRRLIRNRRSLYLRVGAGGGGWDPWGESGPRAKIPAEEGNC
jgi:hypothetical protein